MMDLFKAMAQLTGFDQLPPPQARNYINSLSHMPKRNFADVFLGANPLGKFCFRRLKLPAHWVPLVVKYKYSRAFQCFYKRLTHTVPNAEFYSNLLNVTV